MLLLSRRRRNNNNKKFTTTIASTSTTSIVFPFLTTVVLLTTTTTSAGRFLFVHHLPNKRFASSSSSSSLLQRHSLLSFSSAAVVRAKKYTPKTTTALLSINIMSITNKPVVHAPESLLPPSDWSSTFKERTRVLNKDISIIAQLEEEEEANRSSSSSSSCIVYWMQRDVRTTDNWALSYASYLSQKRQIPLRVVYALQPPPPSSPADEDDDHEDRDDDQDDGFDVVPPNLRMTSRYGHFLLGGLECVYNELKKMNIPLHVIRSTSHSVVGATVCDSIVGSTTKSYNAEIVVCDFNPLREFRQWMELQAAPLLDKADVALIQVDAHNIVPVWTATDKREVGARTLRPRIQRVIQDYLREEAPEVTVLNNNEVGLPDFEREEYERYLNMDDSVPTVDWAIPGTEAGMKQMKLFFKHGLKKYDSLRNDPNERGICSNLSAWINHGHISFQRVVIDTKRLNKYANGTASFIEEGVVRRELSDNYVYYTPNGYDALTAAAGWAQETLQVHSSDLREYVYSLHELEYGRTRDDLWNAAQLQVVRDGRMHGFLRMYWAKKILEWTISPELALQTAQYLNDKYALDGRDPNGFVGVGWSIMGIHDQGWKERPIFGKIRFMNYNGCKRKFNIPNFVARYKGAAENAIKATEQAAAAVKKEKKEEKGQKKKRQQSTLITNESIGSSSKKKRNSKN